MLENFLFRICGCSPTWVPGAFIEEAVERVRAQVGDGRVICGLSGGVDSAAAALLIHRAIGDRLTCVFVDTGCLRAGEPEQVIETFQSHLRIPLVAVDARARFLERLRGVTDPEAKRSVIGEEFVRVFEAEAEKLNREGAVEFLAQGTLYPDVIESATQRIGERAEDQDAPQRRRPPGRYALEAGRAAARPLQGRGRARSRASWDCRRNGLAASVPGPGLAVRVIGEVTQERLETLRAADRDRDRGVRTRWTRTAARAQAFAVLTPVQSVGVMGDGRTYGDAAGDARGDDRRLHDRRLGAPARTRFWRAWRTASSTRFAASTAWSTTSPASRRRRSSGNREAGNMPTDDNDRPAWDLEPLPLGANGHSAQSMERRRLTPRATMRVRVMKGSHEGALGDARRCALLGGAGDLRRERRARPARGGRPRSGRRMISFSR